VQEGCLVPPHRPVKPVRGVPTLFRRHPAKHRNLFRAGLFIRQHEIRVLQSRWPRKFRIFPGWLWRISALQSRLENEQTVLHHDRH
jgi:hypothetical protein